MHILIAMKFHPQFYSETEKTVYIFKKMKIKNEVHVDTGGFLSAFLVTGFLFCMTRRFADADELELIIKTSINII